MPAIDEVHYNGVYWRDIDWSLPVHIITVCDCCGIDGDEEIGVGHENACRYLEKNQQTPAGRAWIRSQIKAALVREGRA